MSQQAFDGKWKEASRKLWSEEFSIFVPPGELPTTQRQLNLYHYYLFLKNTIKGKKYTDALELGCGRGTLALYLRAYEKMNVTCNDVAESAVALARRNFEMYTEKAVFLVGDAASVSLPDHSVDVCVSIGLLEHLDDYTPILREQYRLLRPGGVMVSLNIPKKTSVQILNTPYRSLFGLFFPGYPLKPDYYRNAHTPHMYTTAALNSGFCDVTTTNVNPFPIITPAPVWLERTLTYVYRGIVAFRGLWMRYPYKTNRIISQAHFLVGYKKAE